MAGAAGRAASQCRARQCAAAWGLRPCVAPEGCTPARPCPQLAAAAHVIAEGAAPLPHGAAEGGGQLLQHRQHGGGPRLEQVYAHEDVAVRGEGAAVRVVHCALLGPVLDQGHQGGQARVAGAVVPQQLGVHARQHVVHGDVHLPRVHECLCVGRGAGHRLPRGGGPASHTDDGPSLPSPPTRHATAGAGTGAGS